MFQCDSVGLHPAIPRLMRHKFLRVIDGKPGENKDFKVLREPLKAKQALFLTIAGHLISQIS